MEAIDLDVHEVLQQAPLADLIEAGQPAFVVQTRAAASDAEQGSSVAWANEAALGVFGVRDSAGLSAKLINGYELAIRHLARVAARMLPGRAPQLQKLRIGGAGRTGAVLTWRCWVVDMDGRRLFVAAALDAPAGLCKSPAVTTKVSAPPSAAGETHAAGQALPVTPPIAAPSDRVRGGNVRFLWRSDGDGRLISLDGALCEVMGCETAALVGRTFDELIDTLPLEPAAPLRAALSRRDTWSRIEVLWPFTGSSKCAPVTLGGLPSFDRRGIFDGYSGFGVIHLSDAADRPVEKSTIANTDGMAGPVGSLPAAKPSRSTNVVSLRGWQKDNHATGENTEQSEKIETPATDTAGDAVQHPTDDPANSKATAVQPLCRSVVSRVSGPEGTDITVPSPAQTSREAGEDATSARLEPGATSTSSEDTGAHEGLAEQGEKRFSKESSDTIAPPDHRDDSGLRDGEDDAIIPADQNIHLQNVHLQNLHLQNLHLQNLHLNVPHAGPDGTIELSASERNAFREIARTLGARASETSETADASERPAQSRPVTPAAIAAAIAAIAPEKSAGEEPAAGPIKSIISRIARSPLADAPGRAETDSATGHGVYSSHRENASIAALLDCTGVDVLVLQDGQAVYANRPMLASLGFDSFKAFRDAGGVERVFKGRDPAVLAQEAAGGAIPLITRSGDVIVMNGKLHKVSWNEQPATLLSLQANQTLELDAKLRGLELDIRKRESEARELHAILDTATDGVVLLDDEGRILSLNGSAQALFGYDQNEVAGEKLTILLARESHAAAMDYFNGLKSNGVRSVLNDGREVQGRANKGGAIPLFMTIGRISSSPEQRFCVVLRDVTQWKKAERELSDARREAERTSSLKSDFLAKISHEVRTPLNAILGFAEVIIDERFGPVGNERYKDYLKDIHASGTHVLSLINDLLDLSKIEAGKLELEFGSVDVGKIVNECVSIMQSQAIRERVIMRLSLAPRLPNIVADERSLRQIVLNILSNAVKFNEPGGQVIVSTALTDAGSAVIRVRDTGIGMSDKDVEMALEPFRQIATARRAGGTGLGLPLTKALVEANRASFTIKSKKEEGTLVEVAFPPTRVLAE